MYEFDENLIKILDCQVLGKLPDLFAMEDGSRVTTRQQWEARRQELYRTAVELQYGTMPPEPEFLEVEPLDGDTQAIRNFRITTGPRNHPVSFLMRTQRPDAPGVYPAIIDGDMCWRYGFNAEFSAAVLEQNIMLVMFNRLELAPDRGDNPRKSPLYDAYPGYTFSALAAWAWGYSRCVDALEKLGLADMEHIAFTGHSRGGKTALLAGVLDRRAWIVNSNNSGAGGSGCYRIHMRGQDEYGGQKGSERLSHLIDRFPYWFGPEMPAYVTCEEKLPFDQHFLKALVAPRILLETEAASDLWANPVGTHQTALAAREAYKFLGAEENIRLYFRRGVHFHTPSDISLLAQTMRCAIDDQPMPEGNFKLPFTPIQPIFDWQSPEEE